MSVSRSKRTAQNAVVGFAYQTLSMILSFASRTVFIRTLGNEYLGLNGIFSDVLTLLSMADLGFSTAMAFSFYKPLAEDNKEEIASLIAFYKKVYNTIALVVLGLGLCCIPFLGYIVNTDKEIPHLTVYYLFSLAGVVISYLFVYKTTLLTADQKNYKLVNIRMVTNTLKTVLQILVLILFHNYILYLAIGTGISLINNLIASHKTEQEYPYIKNPKSNALVEKDLKAGIIENMKSVFIYKVSTTVFSATDNIIISMVVSTAAVGLYGNYLMPSQKLLLIEQIVFSAMTASIGNVIAKENAEKKYTIFMAIQSLSLILCGIITTCYAALADDLILVWLGSDFKMPVLVVIAVTINAYFSCALQPLWLYRDASGLYRKTKYIMLVATIENIVLSFVLGKFLGVAGIVFATAISRITTYVWYEPKLLFREYFEKSSIQYFRQLFVNALLCTATAASIGYFGRRFVPSGWIGFFAKAVVVGIISAAFYIGVYYKTEGAQNLIKKVKSIAGRK